MPLILNGSTGISGTDGSAGTPAVQGTDTNTGMFFPAADTIAFAEGGVEAMRLDASGNVMVGTTTPVASNRLTVVGGGVQFSPGTAAQPGVRIQQSSGVCSFTGINNDNNTFNALSFFTGASEAARITTGGDLLVNTTTSRAKVTIKGATSDIYANSGIALEQASNTNRWNILAASTNDFYFGYNSVDKGYIRNTDGAYISLSDRSAKKNIENISYGLSAVMALRSCSYNMSSDEEGSRKSLGFIAQEVLSVVPESVFEMQGGMYGMDKSSIIPVLVKAIQEQQAQIEELKARVAALEAR